MGVGSFEAYRCGARRRSVGDGRAPTPPEGRGRGRAPRPLRPVGERGGSCREAAAKRPMERDGTERSTERRSYRPLVSIGAAELSDGRRHHRPVVELGVAPGESP